MLSDNRATSFIEVSCLISNLLFYAVITVF
jgi:hypothetical protein